MATQTSGLYGYFRQQRALGSPVTAATARALTGSYYDAMFAGRMERAAISSQRAMQRIRERELAEQRKQVEIEQKAAQTQQKAMEHTGAATGVMASIYARKKWFPPTTTTQTPGPRTVTPTAHPTQGAYQQGTVVTTQTSGAGAAFGVGTGGAAGYYYAPYGAKLGEGKWSPGQLYARHLQVATLGIGSWDSEATEARGQRLGMMAAGAGAGTIAGGYPFGTIGGGIGGFFAKNPNTGKRGYEEVWEYDIQPGLKGAGHSLTEFGQFAGNIFTSPKKAMKKVASAPSKAIKKVSKMF